MKKIKWFLFLLLLIGCREVSSVSSETTTSSGSSTDSNSTFTVTNYSNSSSSQTISVSLSSLSNEDIYVIWSGVGSSDQALTDGSGSGVQASSASASYSLGTKKSSNGKSKHNKIPDYVTKFRKNSPKLIKKSEFELNQNQFLLPSQSPNLNTVDVTTRSWHYSSSSTVSTTLRKSSTVGGKTLYIWVNDSVWTTTGEDEKVDSASLDEVVAKFWTDTSDIYNLTKDILGDEWGTHSYSNLISSSTSEIHIVFYDINSDGAWGTLGFYWSAHNYLNTSVSYSNEALVFFMDAPTYGQKTGGTWEVTDTAPTKMLGTLAHEFQHMVHFYQKGVIYGTSSDTWVNEMSSMLIEDLLATYIGGTGTGPAKDEGGRLSNYVSDPNCNLTLWSSTTSGSCTVYNSYETAFSFGGFLVRHYGGKDFLKSVVQSNSSDMTAISSALTAQSASDSWQLAFQKWGVTLAMDTTKGSLPDGYGYPELITGSYTLQSGDMYGFSSDSPFIYSTPPDTLKAYSNVIWKKYSGQSGSLDFSVNVPANTRLSILRTKN
ncbi:MAG: hypothetical protein ACI86H_000554 [bacterium]|jgi:hypothetical protein